MIWQKFGSVEQKKWKVFATVLSEITKGGTGVSKNMYRKRIKKNLCPFIVFCPHEKQNLHKKRGKAEFFDTITGHKIEI